MSSIFKQRTIARLSPVLDVLYPSKALLEFLQVYLISALILLGKAPNRDGACKCNKNSSECNFSR